MFPNAASASKKQEIRGGWIGAVPCAFTSYNPSPGAPTTGTFTCTSGTFWDGSWTGQTMYTAKGTINFLTGDSSGTLDETFYGIATADQSSGTLRFSERYRIYGATNTVHIDVTIVGGTGDWVGSKGHLTFDGVQFLGVAGHGGYAGTWIRR
jgi:hypothetical protein